MWIFVCFTHNVQGVQLFLAGGMGPESIFTLPPKKWKSLNFFISRQGDAEDGQE